MNMVLWLVIAYLAGSIPSAYVITKIIKKIDIRQHGSGNVGATNVFRVAGPWAGTITLVIDALKGYIPVVLCMNAFPGKPLFWILTALMAVVGHVWTVFLNFKGGKGVATGAGIFFALLPVPAFEALIIFLVVFGITKIISVSSMSAAVLLPVFAILRKEPKELIVFAFLICFFIIYTHRSNIKRLKQGTEHKLKRSGPKPDGE